MAGPEDLRVRVREELICAVCLDFLNEPKALACAHSFCLSCLQSVREKHKAVVNGETQGLLECPSCRHLTPLPEGGIAALATHCKLSNLVQVVSSEEKERSREVIRWRKSTYEELESGTARLERMCREHAKPLEFYCEDCGVLLCQRGMMDDHSEHDYGEAIKVLPEHLNYMRSMVQPAHEIAERAEAAMRRLEQDAEAIEKNRGMTIESIRDIFNKLKSVLDERERKLMATVNKYINTKLDTVKEHKQNLSEKHDSVLGIIESLEDALHRPNDLTVLSKELPLSDALETDQEVILTTELEVLRSTFSASYVGFKDDNVASVEKQTSELVTLLEFFPEGDSGYYSSRKIIIEPEQEEEEAQEEEEEEMYIDVRHPHTPRPELRFGKTVRRREAYMSDSDSIDSDSELHSSEQSPLLMHRNVPLVEDIAPLIPIRFDSLLAPTQLVEPLKIFDKLGRSKTESVHPCGVCVCMNDSLVVSDIKNHCLRLLASNGKFIDVIGEEGRGSGNFEEPCGLSVDKQQNILVTQRVNPRIQKFSAAGKYLQKFGQRSLLGSVLGEPWAIAVSPDKKIFISDWEKECIHIYTQGGKYVRSIGNDKETSHSESIQLPAGIAFDQEGNLLVVDRRSHCVWILKQDGVPLRRFGSKGHGPGELYYPYGIAITRDGCIIVSESGNNRISVFSSTGQFLRCFGRKGNQPGMFDHPREVCINSRNEVIVADEINQRLQVFSLQTETMSYL